MTRRNNLTVNAPQNAKGEEIEEIDIDFLLSDVMIIKAESLKSRKIFNYASYLERQLMKIKNREAILDIGVPLK